MAHPLAPPASRLARWSRTTALAATALVVLATVAHGWHVATGVGREDVLTQMQAVEVDGDYVAWTQAGGHLVHTSVRYFANGTPDALVLRQADLPALLAGQAVTPAARLPAGTTIPPPPGGGQGKTLGSGDFRAPAAECPPPTGACAPESVAILVWVEGTAWMGSTLADATHYSVTHEGWEGPAPPDAREGPVHARLAIGSAEAFARAPLVIGTALFGGLVGILALAAYGFASWRAPATRRAGPTLATAGTTEERLMLVRLASLYVDGIRRSYRTSLATILAITVAAMFFGLPPMLERVVAQFPMTPALQEAHVALFVLVPLDVMLVAMGLWTVSYMGVRRELAGWHAASRSVEEEAARIVGA